MRRADRLFQIVQYLRARSLVTAGELARELEVSERTIYRDIADLVASGIPVDGEAGVGYTLSAECDLPPLMFTAPEMEALVMALRIFATHGGDGFAAATRSILTKVENVLPEHLRPQLLRRDLLAPGFHLPAERAAHLAPLRQALEERRKLAFDYTRSDGELTSRTVQPLGLCFWGHAWSLVGWCELRHDFRNFRSDRMQRVQLLAERFEPEAGRDLEAFLARKG